MCPGLALQALVSEEEPGLSAMFGSVCVPSECAVHHCPSCFEKRDRNLDVSSLGRTVNGLCVTASVESKFRRIWGNIWADCWYNWQIHKILIPCLSLGSLLKSKERLTICPVAEQEVVSAMCSHGFLGQNITPKKHGGHTQRTHSGFISSDKLSEIVIPQKKEGGVCG